MPAAEVFIVHLWRAGGARRDFRAAVQRAGSDESAWFTRAQAMVRFLEQQAGAPADAHDRSEASGQPASAR